MCKLNSVQLIDQLNSSLLTSDKSKNTRANNKLLALCAPDTNSILFCRITIMVNAIPNSQEERKLPMP